MIPTVKFVLQMIGLAVIIWFVYVIYDEYKKLRQKEKDNGPPRGL